MNKPDFETYKKRLRSLKNFRDMSDIEFSVIAQKKYDEKYADKPEENKSIVISSEEFENEVGLWISKEEADEALEQYTKYVKSRNIIDVSDLALLKNLCFYEAQLKRVARAINEEYRNVKAQGKTADVPAYELKTINSINEQIIELKKVLGLAEEQKGADPFIYIEQLKKKYTVDVIQITSGGKSIYKVRVGKFKTRDEAMKITQKLNNEDKISKTIIVSSSDH